MSLQQALGYAFRDASLLETALTHPSRSNQADAGPDNERLEFLGDAVLDVVVAEALYRAHPDWAEGTLTRARAALVNAASLAARARALGLGGHLRLGRTEERSGGEDKQSILAAAFEAVVGAVYLDGGLEAARGLVGRLFGEALASDAPPAPRDPKTRFQEWAHAALRATPGYRTLADSGDDADPERFTVAVHVAGEEWARGRGRTKRGAQRDAAARALARAEEAAGGADA